MSLLDKAKAVTGGAAQKAAELKDHAAGLGSNVADRASTLSEHTKHLAGDVRERASALSAELADAAMDRAKAAMADLNAALPLLKRAGYALNGVTLQLGVPPKLTPVFTLAESVPDDDIERLLAENPDAKLAAMLVKTLVSAHRLQSAIHIGGLRPTGIAVDITFPPSVSIKFEP
jgi:hypothetical protein